MDRIPLALPAPAIEGPAEGLKSEELAKQRNPGPGFWAALGWLLMYVLLQVAAVVPFAVLDEMTGSKTIMIAAVVASSILGILIPAAVFWGRGSRLLAVRGIRPAHLVVILALLLPMLIVELQAVFWASRLTRTGPGPEAPEMYRQLAELPWFLLLLLGCVLPAVGEETFFRGFLGRGLVARRGIPLGMGLTALSFGVLHFDSPEHVLGTVLLGLCLQTVLLLTRTLAAPVLLHVANNALAFGIDKLRGPLGALDGGSSEELNGPPIMLGLTAAAAMIALIVLLYQMRARWLLEDGSDWSPGYTTPEMPPAPLRARVCYGSARVPTLVGAAVAMAAFSGVLVWSLVSP